MTTAGYVGESMRTWQMQEALEDLYSFTKHTPSRNQVLRVAKLLVSEHDEHSIYHALDLAASDPRFELAQQSGWLQQVRDAVTELL